MANASVSPVRPKDKAARVLFVRVGSMKFYAGPQEGDEKPRGGGRYTKEGIGHELFNFFKFGDRLYGFVRAVGEKIDLDKIDPAARGLDALADVRVIFVAKQRIVGWYEDALVHRKAKALPGEVDEKMRAQMKQRGENNFKPAHYSFEGPAHSAKLLPSRYRTHDIRGNKKGGFGTYNVCYPYNRNGARKLDPWMDEAVSYVGSYDKGNLLTHPILEGDTEDSAAIAQEQAEGFRSNADIRRAIEAYAMERAKKELERRGYENIKDKSGSKPYDYECVKGRTRYVEVKGTQTLGKSILLTRNEVEHVRLNPKDSILVLVRSVKVSEKKGGRPTGGEIVVIENWQLNPEPDPIQYTWAVKPRDSEEEPRT
ncbi:MAG: hypothetical protein DMG21_18675 [Acidobacteria bacterium]|nr:MAG: hypothetical protein DMG21_18675 [Acidobacteriota bacterium]